MPKIEVMTRKQIAEFLPKALEAAIVSYQLFSDKSVSEDADKFKKYHGACKVAIAHIELLLKLAKLADLPDDEIESENERDILLGLIENGRKELDCYKIDG